MRILCMLIQIERCLNTKLNDQSGGCEDLKKAAELGDDDSKEYLENHYCD